MVLAAIVATITVAFGVVMGGFLLDGGVADQAQTVVLSESLAPSGIMPSDTGLSQIHPVANLPGVSDRLLNIALAITALAGVVLLTRKRLFALKRKITLQIHRLYSGKGATTYLRRSLAGHSLARG